MPAVFKVILGVFMTFGLHVVVWLLLVIVVSYLTYIPALSSLSFVWTLGIVSLGLSQLFYIIPLVLYLARRRKFSWMRGVIIGATMTALLNGGLLVMVYLVDLLA